MIEEPITIPLPLNDPSDLSHIHPQLRSMAGEMAILIPDPENANKHDLRNLTMIAESLSRFGQRTPIVVNRLTNFISKGNGTYMAAKMLGWSMIARMYTDDPRAEALAYGLIDNRTSATSRPDYSQTGKHLKELQASDYPMSKFWNEEEAMPLLRQEFAAAPISDEKFDTSLQKGRAIKQVSASERIIIDRAIALVRSKSPKPVTEGSALELICGEFMAVHANECDNSVQDELDAMPPPLSLE